MDYGLSFSKSRALLWMLAPAVLSLLSGCETTGGKPAWVNNPKTMYPESDYLVAIGEGDTRSAAENMAAANLSRIFESRIESDERMQENSRETNDSFARTVDFVTDVSVHSAQTLFNVQYAESWVDDKTARVHAIAYLDRSETAKLYRQKINEKSERVDFFLEQAKQADNALKEYASLRAAARVAAENSTLLEQLNVIHPFSASASAPSYDANNLYQELANAAQKIQVKIRVAGDSDRRIAAMTEQLITSYGFVIGESPVLNVIGTVTVTDTGRKADLDYVRYSLNLQIADAAAHILVSVNEQGQEAHMSPAEAKSRAFRTLENSIKKGGSQRLDAYFDSLIDQ